MCPNRVLPSSVIVARRRKVAQVALVDDAQAFESQQVVHLANVLRAAAHQRSQSAGGDHLHIAAEFGDQRSRMPSINPRYP